MFEYKLHDSYSFDLEEKGYGKSALRKKWSIHDLYSTAIGYSITETPLNMLTFYNAIANNGRMMQPYLIDAHLENGKVTKKFEPKVLNASICSKTTVDSLTSALKTVAREGTAKRLKNAKCEIAGKTGTTNDNSDGWFVGYTPSLAFGAWVGGEERDVHFCVRFNKKRNGR